MGQVAAEAVSTRTAISIAGGKPAAGVAPLPRHATWPNLVVSFDEPGTYLVTCGILPHFAGGMYGYVRVLPE